MTSWKTMVMKMHLRMEFDEEGGGEGATRVGPDCHILFAMNIAQGVRNPNNVHINFVLCFCLGTRNRNGSASTGTADRKVQ